MSERIAAVVCEGQGDFPILERVIQTIWPEVGRVLPLQPKLDSTGVQLSGNPFGWPGVQKWCERYADRLDEVIKPPVGPAIDLLLVAIDCDIAKEAKIPNPSKQVTAADAKKLCGRVKEWLGTTGLPSQLVIAIPAMSIETWAIGALDPTIAKPETISDPTERLSTLRQLRRDRGKPKKELAAYLRFAESIVTNLPTVRRKCPEAERTCAKIEARRDAVEV